MGLRPGKTTVVNEHDLIQHIPELNGRTFVVAPLEGGLTNRNFRLDDGRESLVLRMPGQNTDLLGIDRACEVACSRAAAALGVAPQVVGYSPEHGAIVRRFAAGKVLAADDLQRPEVLGRIVDVLRRYHAGAAGAGSFSPFTTVRRYHALARDRRVSFPHDVGRALDRLAEIELAAHSDDAACPCHNDLLPANFIDDGSAVWIIDWEYAGMGDRFFDLGNLAVNCDFNGEQERMLLELYFGDARPEHLRRLRLMRLASDLREAMWGFLQSGLSSLDVDYIAYGRKHLDRFLNSPLPT